MPKEHSIKNILFDLGGVILDIDVQATLKRFYELDFPSELLQYPNNMTSDLFFRYETGKISTGEFRNEVRRITGLDVSDEELNKAWNAMILRIPGTRTQLLDRLKERYDLYMLSNTSPLHVPVFEQMYLETAGRPMKDLFKKIYYSFDIGWHKPDAEAWEYVINDAGIVPQETLFLDDSIHNIKASKELGFQAIHIHERTSLTDLGFDL
ncbi:MAG: HAD family phosphatase [Bacteroidetes bacterium]|nr:HAD family phosphatase [Bacteroidota bacterium]